MTFAVDSTTPLFVRELRDFCELAKHIPDDADEEPYREFCRTPLVRLDLDIVPRVLAIRCFLLQARGMNEQNAPNHPCFVARGAAVYGAAATNAAGLQSAFIGAATDVLYARAQDAVKQDVMELFGRRVCNASSPVGPPAFAEHVSVDSLLAEACAAIRRFAEPDVGERYASPLPGLNAIRTSFRRDLLATPQRLANVGGRVRAKLAAVPPDGNGTNQDYARAVLALSVLHLGRGLASSQSPGLVLRMLADSLGVVWVNGNGFQHVSKLPALPTLAVGVGIASTIEGAWDDARIASLTPSQLTERVEVVARATLLSYADEAVQGWPHVLRQWYPGLQATAVNQVPALRATDELVQAFAALPTPAQFKSASADERRTMALRSAELLVPAIAVLLEEGKAPNEAIRALRTAGLVATQLAGENYAGLVRAVILHDSLLVGGAYRLLPPRVADGLVVAAEVALAADGDAMRAALESAIAPANRYLAKRTNKPRRATVWLNSYVGGVGSYERLVGSGAGDEFEPAAGIALPIGVEINTSRYAGILIQLLDLGQVLNYRLGDTSSVRRDPPGATLESVFSPGLMLAWRPTGFMQRRPYAILVGASYSPRLRERKIGEERFAKADAVRISLGFGVDVPLFP